MNQITNFQEIYMKHRIKQIHVTDLFNREKLHDLYEVYENHNVILIIDIV